MRLRKARTQGLRSGPSAAGLRGQRPPRSRGCCGARPALRGHPVPDPAPGTPRSHPCPEPRPRVTLRPRAGPPKPVLGSLSPEPRNPAPPRGITPPLPHVPTSPRAGQDPPRRAGSRPASTRPPPRTSPGTPEPTQGVTPASTPRLGITHPGAPRPHLSAPPAPQPRGPRPLLRATGRQGGSVPVPAAAPGGRRTQMGKARTRAPPAAFFPLRGHRGCGPAPSPALQPPSARRCRFAQPGPLL